MNSLEKFIQEQLARPSVAREYYRLAPFFDLANQLLLLRKQRGLSQQELAEKANTTQAVVSRLENVAVHCSLESVIRLAEALGAAVEVRLKPLEELNPGKPVEVDNGCEEFNDFDRQGKVFFGKNPGKPCNTVDYYHFDPASGQVLPANPTVHQNKAEIA